MSAEETHTDCGHTVCELYQVLSEIYVSTTAHLEAKRYRNEILREAAEKIRVDMERQAAGGQYGMGMKRSAFLIDPDKP